MEVCDFSRSFVMFVALGRANNARIQVECACEMTEPDGESREFLLVASCKAEATFAEDDLFRTPNYDFCGIFSSTDYQIIRTHATADEGGAETGTIAGRFEGVRIDVVRATGRVCESAEQIVRATLDNVPLVARTELWDDDSGRRAVIEYPIKTINANDERNVYQVDTGPVVFPDLARSGERRIDCLGPAFVAFNVLDRAEFILQASMPIETDTGGQIVVRHYGQVRKVAARNEIIAITS